MHDFATTCQAEDVSSFDKACKGKEEEDEGESLSIVMAVESDDREPDFLLFRKDRVSLLCKAEAGGLKTLTLNRAFDAQA